VSSVCMHFGLFCTQWPLSARDLIKTLPWIWRHNITWWRHSMTSQGHVTSQVHVTSQCHVTSQYDVTMSRDVTTWRHQVTWRHKIRWRHNMTSQGQVTSQYDVPRSGDVRTWRHKVTSLLRNINNFELVVRQPHVVVGVTGPALGRVTAYAQWPEVLSYGRRHLVFYYHKVAFLVRGATIMLLN
jgi:hypothetical protein